MRLRLREIAADAGIDLPDNSDITCTAITEDSRQVTTGSVFAAITGDHHDGHQFAESAVAAGAVAILGDREKVSEVQGVPYIHATKVRTAVGRIAHALYDDPSNSLSVVGITGTNGKTSTALLTAHTLEHAGHKTASLGTLGYHIGSENREAPHTTPFGPELAALFAEARDAECSHLVMEVSSHAIAQDRIAGIVYSAAAFTNLTQDHLDYHETMDEYLASKLELFDRVSGVQSFCVVNQADPYAEHFIARAPTKCITFGPQGDCRPERITRDGSRTRFTVHTPWGVADISIPLLGEHNVSNATCAIAIAGGFGVGIGEIASALESAPGVPGRFELIDEGQDFLVVVDYAHTDDGLTNVLRSARALNPGRIVTVFGCGGDRDRAKRPRMARAAAEGSDHCILTSDNPRSEDPQQIIRDAEQGFTASAANATYESIEDRRSAIRHAIAMAQASDLVMIAGKGHEDYQILSAGKIHFDDREEARAAIKDR